MRLGRYAALLCLMFTVTASAISADDRIVVFVPGILGSELTADGVPIWGQANTDESKLLYTPDQHVVAETLDVFFVREMFGLFNRVVYGDLMTEMNSDLTSPERFIPFGYDWRASNAESARRLHTFLCEQSAKGPIVLVGHSMGGLVIKHWIADSFSAPCPNGASIRIENIVFAATPHRGSPQAIMSLINEVELDDQFNWLVAGGINRVGYSFDSLYELLPASLAKDDLGYCLRGAEGAEVRAATYSGSTGEPGAVDLFDANVFVRLGILDRFWELKDLPDPVAYLQDKLDRAEANICKLANLELPAALNKRVWLLAGFGETASGGQRPNDTVLQLAFHTPISDVLSDEEYGDTNIKLVVTKGVGDGTVPMNIAMDGNKEYVEPDSLDILPIRADHQAILNSTQFKGLVSQLRAGTEAPTSVAQATSYNTLVTLVGRQTLAAVVDRKALVDQVAVNSVWASIAASQRYENAKTIQEPILLEAVGGDPQLDPTLQAWALQNAATIYASKNLGMDSLRASLAAEAVALTLTSEQQAGIMPRIFNTRGAVLWGAGNVAEAEDSYLKALEFNPDYALALQGIERITKSSP